MGKKARTELRGDMKKVLRSLDPRWIEAASHELCNHLTEFFSHNVPTSKQHVLCWAASFPGEVDLSSFIGGQLGTREVYLPRVLPDKSMTFISIGADWREDTEDGIHGIAAPREDSGTIYQTENADDTVVLVPGLAFDKSGARLGRGGGYYDRFLSHSRMLQAMTIGTGWMLQLLEHVPKEAHDIPVQWICHERGIIEASQ